MTNITIPPEALEAGKDAAFNWLRSFMKDDVRVKSMTDDELGELVCAALAAALNAWPGAIRPSATVLWPPNAKFRTYIILPLQETQNAE